MCLFRRAISHLGIQACSNCLLCAFNVGFGEKNIYANSILKISYLIFFGQRGPIRVDGFVNSCLTSVVEKKTFRCVVKSICCVFTS